MAVRHGNTAMGSVPISCPRAVVQAAAPFGVERGALLRDAGIPPELLRQAGQRIATAQYMQLYRLAVARSGEPDLGLHVGHIIYFTGMNLHLYMTTICRNLKEYFNVIPSTVQLRGDLGRILVRPRGDYLRLEWHPLQHTLRDWRPLHDEMLKSSVEIVNAICVLPVPVMSAELAYPAPDDTRGLQRAFGPNLKFGCKVSAVIFPREAVRYPLVDLGLSPGGDFWAEPRSMFDEPENVDPLLRDIRAAMRRLLPGGELTIDYLSAELGVSRRTLQRRLRSLDTSFKALLQEVRQELALRYLDDPRLAITEIALLLGYSDQASFSNAFRSWRGCAPSDYRQRAAGC